MGHEGLTTMKHSLIPIFLFFFVAFALSINYAYAVDEVSLIDWPTYLATQLGISLFAAQIMASVIILALVLLPCMLLTKNIYAHIIFGISALGLTIALGWLPVYLFALISVALAIMLANKLSRMIS